MPSAEEVRRVERAIPGTKIQILAREDADPAETAQRLRAVNPRYIPRNHQVEAVITAAVERDDFAPFHAMVEAMADPFTQRDAAEPYATPPEPEERVTQTFCGT